MCPQICAFLEHDKDVIEALSIWKPLTHTMRCIKTHGESMRNSWLSRLKSIPWLAAALLAPSLAFAQMPDGAPPKVDYQLSYRSALAGYEVYKEQSVQPWKAANDKVGEIGGWRAYAKEMRQSAPAAGQDQPAQGHDAHHGGKQ